MEFCRVFTVQSRSQEPSPANLRFNALEELVIVIGQSENFTSSLQAVLLPTSPEIELELELDHGQSDRSFPWDV